MRKPNENALDALAALLDTWQPEAPETDLWPQIATRLSKAEAHFKGERQQVPLVITPELREQAQKSGEAIQRMVAYLEPCGTDVKSWIAAVERLTAANATLQERLLRSAMEVGMEPQAVLETAGSGDRDRLPPQPPTTVGTGSEGDLDPRKELPFTAFVADRGGAESVVLLTPRQERWLARCVESGGEQAEKARGILVNANLRLVTSIAKKYQNRGIAMEDLIQEGTLGLIHAVDKYDWRRGFRFSTYAMTWIRQAVGRAVENQGRTIRLPDSALAHLERIHQARDAFSATHGRLPTPAELAEAVHLPQERVELLLEAHSTEPTRLGDLLPAEDTTSPSSQIFRRALREEINKALDHLSSREKEVLSLRYGLSEDQEQPMTLEQVGNQLQLTREQARQIEAGALQKLRRSEPTEERGASKALAELSGTLSEVVDQLAGLRREVTRLREEVAALRRERSGTSYPTLMPYARADDKPLPLG